MTRTRVVTWPCVHSLQRTFSTRLQRRRKENTSSKGWFRAQTASSWTWNVQVSMDILNRASRGSILDYFAGCYKITTVFSHAQTVVLCVSCSTVLAQPTGGRARLTEGMGNYNHNASSIDFMRIAGCSFRRKPYWTVFYSNHNSL